ARRNAAVSGSVPANRGFHRHAPRRLLLALKTPMLLSIGRLIGFAAALLLLVTDRGAARQAAPTASQTVIFRNVRVFSGTGIALSRATAVGVGGKAIAGVGSSAAALDAGATVIDCGGRTLMPGLIAAHWHAMLAAVTLPVLMTADIGYINLVAGKTARDTLL